MIKSNGIDKKTVVFLKYISIDRLSDFEFHDVKITLDSFINNRLTVKANFLNIHKSAEQNPFQTDMEIESARITFEGFQIISYEPGRAWKKDEKGDHSSNEPQVILFDDEAHRLFLMQLEKGFTIFDFNIKEGKTYFIDATSSDPFFTVCFTLDRVIIAWDDYQKEAWYTSC